MKDEKEHDSDQNVRGGSDSARIVDGGAKLRPMGLFAGKFVVPDDFNAPLPEEVLREFEGG